MRRKRVHNVVDAVQLHFLSARERSCSRSRRSGNAWYFACASTDAFRRSEPPEFSKNRRWPNSDRIHIVKAIAISADRYGIKQQTFVEILHGFSFQM